jgi:hypothetical protein
MSKQRLILTVVAVVALLAVAVAALATTGGSDATEELVVFDPRTEVLETFLDLGEEGFSAGDVIVEHTALVDPETGEARGRAVTRIQVIEVLEPPSHDNPMGDFVLILDCTYEFDEGNISFYGSEEFHNIVDGMIFTVVGGTGDYTGVTGTVAIAGAEIDGQEGVTATFQLTSR